MTALRRRVAAAMADGGFHDGAALCAALRVAPAELWRALNELSAAGLPFEAAPGRGYRLLRPVELLDEAAVLAAMAPGRRAMLAGVEVLDEVDSTNRRLADGARAGLPAGFACLAETQTAGRGRQGRPWISPYAANLYLSLLWEFAAAPAAMGGLALACGVAVARAAQRAGAPDIGLKWPNDVLVDGGKLGGILLEDAGGGRHGAVIIGVGLNLRLTEAAAQRIDQRAADLETAAGAPVPRNAAAAWLLEELTAAAALFQAAGLAPFIEQWRQYDIMRGKRAVLRWPGGQVSGIVEGIDAGGDLILSVNGEARTYRYGEVSLRDQP